MVQLFSIKGKSNHLFLLAFLCVPHCHLKEQPCKISWLVATRSSIFKKNEYLGIKKLPQSGINRTTWWAGFWKFLKIFYQICEWVGLQNVQQHYFLQPGGQGGEGDCGTQMPTEIVRMAPFRIWCKCDRFFTTFCDPKMSHILRPLITFCPEKAQKVLFWRKMLEVRIIQDKTQNLKD